MAHGTMWPLAGLALLLVSGSPLRSDTSPEVPFELYQQHLIVTKGAIGPLNDLNLLIDTGTIPSVVDQRVARKLRLPTERAKLIAFGQLVQIHSAVLEGFRIGPLSSGQVPAAVGDLSYLDGIRIDAIVGLDVLARTSFAIDYRRGVLELTPASTADSSAQLEVTWPFLTTRLTTAGHQLRLLVDTGSRDLVLFTTRLPVALPKFPWRGDKTVRYASGVARLRRLDLRQVSLGTDRWDTLPAWALDRAPDGYPPGIDGVLGVKALGCHRVQFDFERKELGWSR